MDSAQAIGAMPSERSPIVTIPKQSSVAECFQEFDDAGRMKPLAYYERVVGVVEQQIILALLYRDEARILSTVTARGGRAGLSYPSDSTSQNSYLTDLFSMH